MASALPAGHQICQLGCRGGLKLCVPLSPNDITVLHRFYGNRQSVDWLEILQHQYVVQPLFFFFFAVVAVNQPFRTGYYFFGEKTATASSLVRGQTTSLLSKAQDGKA